jgi:quercetin dioxygenase-like cupin family protein
MRYPLIAALSLIAANAAAQNAPTTDVAHAVVALPDRIAWGPAPPSLPPGAKLAVLEGNPGEAGTYAMRLRLPSGYRFPPHYHPGVEHVTVLQGSFKVGMGERFDPSAMTALPVGAFAALQPGTRHFAEAEGETVLQLHGAGPWGITYVNPVDDPRRSTP